MSLGQFADPACVDAGAWTFVSAMLAEGASRTQADGDAGIRISSGGSAVNVVAVDCEAGEDCAIAFWAKASGPAPLGVLVSADGTSWTKLASLEANEDWSFFVVPFVPTKNAFYCKLTSPDGWDVDDIAAGSLPATSKTYVSLTPTNLSSSSAAFPKGLIGAGVLVTVAVDADGIPTDPEARRILLGSDDFEEA